MGRSPASPSAPLAPRPQPGAPAPTEVEAFVLVLGVEEDALGVGVDVGAGLDEHRGDVSLPPLDGDVQRRLPCGQDRGGRLRSAAGTGGDTPSLAYSPLCPLYPPPNRGEMLAACLVCVAQLHSSLHSFLRGNKDYSWSICSVPHSQVMGTQQDLGCSFDSCPQEAHSLPAN